MTPVSARPHRPAARLGEQPARATQLRSRSPPPRRTPTGGCCSNCSTSTSPAELTWWLGAIDELLQHLANDPRRPAPGLVDGLWARLLDVPGRAAQRPPLCRPGRPGARRRRPSCCPAPAACSGYARLTRQRHLRTHRRQPRPAPERGHPRRRLARRQQPRLARRRRPRRRTARRRPRHHRPRLRLAPRPPQPRDLLTCRAGAAPPLIDVGLSG